MIDRMLTAEKVSTRHSGHADGHCEKGPKPFPWIEKLPQHQAAHQKSSDHFNEKEELPEEEKRP